MTRMVAGLALLFMILGGAWAPCAAECPRISVEVRGEVVGGQSDSGERIRVEISPDSGSGAKEIPVRGDYFNVEVPFDSTRSEGRVHHNCTRVPEQVVVKWIRSGEVVTEVVLDPENDFSRSSNGDYRLRSGLRLERGGSC